MGIADVRRGLRWSRDVSSSVVEPEVLSEVLPDEVLVDFLLMCGMPPHLLAGDDDPPLENRPSLAALIDCAPSSVRDCVLANLRQVSLLADDAGLQALRAANAARGNPVNPLHLPDAPAQCALWMYLRHRDLFDEAARSRGVHQSHTELVQLDALRQPLPVPDGLVVDRVRLFEATLLDEDTGGEIAVKAPHCDPSVGVLDLLDTWMPTDNPMRQSRFRVVAAKLGVDLHPEKGRPSGRSIMLELKRRGGSNLADLDAETRARMEAWLKRWRMSTGRAGRETSSLSTAA